jgi:hypothetical protein
LRLPTAAASGLHLANLPTIKTHNVGYQLSSDFDSIEAKSVNLMIVFKEDQLIHAYIVPRACVMKKKKEILDKIGNFRQDRKHLASNKFLRESFESVQFGEQQIDRYASSLQGNYHQDITVA